METILLTGGTGFVGSFLSLELLKKGYFVIFLARPKGLLSAKERIDLILKFIDPNMDKSLFSCYEVIEGDITKPGLGISKINLDRILNLRPTKIFHSAASIDFSPEKKEMTWLVNVEGTKNILNFASQIGIREFHHLSTLYVAGNREGKILESELFVGQSFNNPYEESKAYAEILVQNWAENTKEVYKIYRLPIIVGDSQTGKTLSFSGFYRFFQPFWQLKELIKEKIKINPLLKQSGIELKNGYISTPLFIKCSNNSLIDLVPIDWIVKIIYLLNKKYDKNNIVFHLSHPLAPSSAEVIKKTLPIIGLRGFKLVFLDGNVNIKFFHDKKVLNIYQRMVDKITSEYFAYNINKKKFDNKNVVQVLEKNYFPPPLINSNFLRKIINYAVNHNFKLPPFV